MPGILLIQTASIGDVILITPVIEKLNSFFPGEKIDVLLKKGNEGLFQEHPLIHELLIWDKSKNKFKNSYRLFLRIRKNGYQRIINFQRFASTGFITAFSGASFTAGFDKNPFSFLFTKRIRHEIYPESSIHETARNLKLIQSFTDNSLSPPKLYPTAQDNDFVREFKGSSYICIAPASLWGTKQFPASKWIEFIIKLSSSLTVYLVGASSDAILCEEIKKNCSHNKIINLAGKLNMLQSASLMKDALMNYVNDSAPMHLASSVNAPTAAIYCSTIPDFGFGPLSEKSFIIETKEKLECRPCGLHGHDQCPEGHFNCALTIPTDVLISCLNS